MSTIDMLFVKMMTPNWLYATSEYLNIPVVSPILRKTRMSFDHVRSYMLEIISLARAQAASGALSHSDAALLRTLTEANLLEVGDYKRLNDDELLSDTFVSVPMLFEITMDRHVLDIPVSRARCGLTISS